MPLLKTNTYQVELPEGFEKVAAEFEYFTYQNTKLAFTVQPAQINMALSRQDELDDWCEGTTFLERLQSYFKQKRYNVTVGEFIEKTLCGATLYIQHATSSYKPAGQKKEQEFCHIFAVLLVDDTYMLEFSTDYEKEASEMLTPVFLKTLESLVLLGNFESFYKVQNDALDIRYGRIEEKIDDITAQAEAITENLSSYKDTIDISSLGLPDIPEFCIPSDQKNICKIGDYTFDFIEEECDFSIPDFSRSLYIKIRAQNTGKKISEKIKLLYESNDTQDIEISISLPRVCKSGKAERKIEIIEDKTNETHYEYLRKEGFDFSLDFYGTLEIRDGWVAFLGYLKAPYHEKPIFPINIYKNIEKYPLAWEEYIFTSYEETLGVDEKKIRYITFEDPSFEVFPDRVQTFKNLKELRLNHKGYNETEKLPFRELPRYIGDFKELEVLSLHSVSVTELPESLFTLPALKNLSIDNAFLKELPESFGKLTNLEFLSFQNNSIKNISEKIFQGEKLNYLNLSYNTISELPENISLPHIAHLNLSNNLLTTLPEALCNQVKLEKITVGNNLLISLPPKFNEIDSLVLSLEDKKRLLDYRYRGADGKGALSWDDSIYFAHSEPSLQIWLKDLIKNIQDTDERISYITSLVKRTLYFQVTENEDYADIGNTRFGGMPDLPQNISYPSFQGEDQIYKHEFLAQINCAQITYLQDYMPRSGILYFFLETIHNFYDGNSKKSPIRVIYSENTQDLVSGKALNFRNDEYFEMYEGGGYSGYKIDPYLGLSSPYFYSIHTNNYLLADRKDIDEDYDFTDILSETFEQPINDTMIHDAAMNSYGFTQHESPELQAAQTHKGNPEDWIILLKMKSFKDFQWGDAGDLFFVIHKSDLAKKDFSRVYLTMESS